MKRAIVFVVLAVFLVSVTASTVSAPIVASFTPHVRTLRDNAGLTVSFSSIIEAIAKFEGTLQAYSVSEDPNVEEQVFLASDAISSSLEDLNAGLTAVYSSIDDEEQSALIEVYSSLGVYLGELAEEAIKAFQDDEGIQMANFEFQVDIDGKGVNKFGGYWIGLDFLLGNPLNKVQSNTIFNSTCS